MNEKEILTKKFKLVDMNEVDISTLDKPIIGTQALSTCVGVLLYCEEKKKAIVGHCSSDWKSIIHQTINFIFENGLDSSVIKYKIIPGFYYNNYHVLENLEEAYSSLRPMFVPFDEGKIPDNAIERLEEIESSRFAFDASSGMFVTDKVLFGLDYLNVIHDKKSSNKNR